jgi:hypothetical protein
LYQVEYAMEAISNAGAAIGVLAKDGVVLAAEKRVISKLLATSKSTEKMYKIDDHVACAVAGIMADANILINTARLQAQRFVLGSFILLRVPYSIFNVCPLFYIGNIRSLSKLKEVIEILGHVNMSIITELKLEL